MHLSELETRFSFVDALIISRSMLVELHLPLNCHLAVVRDLTSRKVVDGRGPELVNYRKKPDFRYNTDRGVYAHIHSFPIPFNNLWSVDMSSLSVDPIAYNRISTWKTGILRARACWILHDRIRKILRRATARALDPAGLRANCASGLDTPCSVHERCPSIYAG